MTDRPIPGPRVGRILTSEERSARMADETAFTIDGEVLRSAFAISSRHVLTAWHCVRDPRSRDSSLWFRLRRGDQQERRYIYVPVRLANYDETFDVAALTLDEPRLAEVDLVASSAAALLAEAVIPLGVDIHVKDQALVMGFPESASGADSDTNSAEVIDTRLPFGSASGIKLFGPAFAAVSPVDPHGLSGGPVIRTSEANALPYRAVGVIRALPTGSLLGAASGGCLIATRIEDLVDNLPEVAVALQATQRAVAVPQYLTASRGMNALTMSRACWRRLRDSVVVVDDPEIGTLTGWPHFFNEPIAHRRPTAIGTAYGLKLALVLGEQDYGLDRSGLAATLWKLQRPDGGWAVRTGTGISRPEVSALVLGTLASCGFDAALLAAAGTTFESALSPGVDSVAVERTYIASAVMRGLIRTRPGSSRLAQLRTAMLSGAIQDPDNGNLLCWSGRLKADGNEALVPSIVHTAQAVVALVRTSYVLGDDTQSRTTVDQAVRWLSTRRDLSNQTEQIRRFVRDNHPWETLTVRHFTAAWAARALLLASPTDLPGAEALLGQAIRQVCQSHHDGYWEWDDGDRPLWMSYQGASVVRDYAMRTSTALP